MRCINKFAMVLVVFTLILLIGCQQFVKFPKDQGDTAVAQKKVGGKSGLPEKLEDPNITMLNWTTEGDFAEAIKNFEQKYGGKVNSIIIPLTQFEAKIVTSISSGEAIDVLYWSSKDMPRYAIKGYVQPIEDYLDVSDPLWEDGMNGVSQFKYKGKLYGLNQGGGSPKVIYYNKTMFENNGLKTPMEYYKEGKWNWNTFRECGIALTRDTNNDGVIDQWGFDTNDYSIFVTANGGDFVNVKDDGSVEVTANDPKVIEALQFIQDSFIQDKFMIRDPKFTENFVSGKLAMVAQSAPAYAENNIKGKIKDEWDLAPFPAGPSGIDGISPGGIASWAIGGNAKNPIGAAMLLYMKGKLSKDIEPVRWKDVVTDEQYNLYKKLSKKTKISRFDGVDVNKKVPAIINQVRAGKPVVSTVEQYIPELQASADLLLQYEK